MPAFTQVHEEFKQNVENVTVDMLLRKFAESKGTGREKPGEWQRGLPALTFFFRKMVAVPSPPEGI